MEKKLTFKNESETAVFARLLAHNALGAGQCVLLRGALGAGKTAFSRYIIRALCGEGVEVVSPTFLLVQDYRAHQDRGGFPLYHYDLYRLEDASEVMELGLDESLMAGLVLVEWPDIAAAYWPDSRLEIQIDHVEDAPSARSMLVSAHGDMVEQTKACIERWEEEKRACQE